MSEVFIPTQSSPNIEIPPPPPSERPPKNKKNWYFWIVLVVLLLIAATFEEYVKELLDGNFELRPERVAKLEKELEELDEAVQYVLMATVSDNYQCFNCGNRTEIFFECWRSVEIWLYNEE